MFQFSCAHKLRRETPFRPPRAGRFNSHVRTDCIFDGRLFVSSAQGFNSHVRTGCVYCWMPIQRHPGRFNSHVRTGCVAGVPGECAGFHRFNSHVRTDCIVSTPAYSLQKSSFNSHVRTGCVPSIRSDEGQVGRFNSHVRTGFVSKNKQKHLLITINLAQLYCPNSSAHSILLAIKGDLLLLHRCEPPCKIMWTDASRAQYANTCSYLL